MTKQYLESKLLETNSQSGEGLITSSSLGNNGKLRRGAVSIARGNLESRNIRRLKSASVRSCGKGSSLQGLGSP